MRPVVLVFGLDYTLLSLRAKVLSGVGNRVLLSTVLEYVQDLLRIERIDVVVLCHTVSDLECQRVLNQVALSVNDPKVIRLTTGSRYDVIDVDAFLNPLDGPRHLIETVERLSCLKNPF